MDDIKKLVKEFISILDTTEVSDNGHRWHPNQLSSCRVVEGVRMNAILLKLKELIYE